MDDNQLSVYSLEMADLICNIFASIEGLSKDIYKYLSNKETGIQPLIEHEEQRINSIKGTKAELREPKFDEDALKSLDLIWDLSSKKIEVSSDLIFFTKELSLIKPLNKIICCNDCCNDRSLNDAYQSIKHNRIANIKKATVKNVIEALGALYILCLYGKYAVKPVTMDDGISPEPSLVDLYSNFNQLHDSKLFVSEPFNVIIDNLESLEEMSDNQNNVEQDKILKDFSISKIRESLFLVQDQDILLDEVFFGYQFDRAREKEPDKNMSIFTPNRFICGVNASSCINVPIRENIGFGGYITSWEGENFHFIKANGYDRNIVLNTYCFYDIDDIDDIENNKPKNKCKPLYNWKKLKERLAYQKEEAADYANAANQKQDLLQ